MENTLSDLFFKISGQYGVLTAALVIALIVFVLVSIKPFLKYAAFQFFPFSKKNPLQLKRHPCFIELDHFLNYTLYRLNVQCPIRKKLFFDIMQKHVLTIKESLANFIQTDINKLTPQELFYKMDDLVMQSINSSNMALIAAGTPEFVLRAMDEKIQTALHFHHEQMKTYCYNHYLYGNNVSKMWAIMELIPIAVEYYMNLLESSLSEFNGDIKKLNYKGVKCIKCPKCMHTD